MTRVVCLVLVAIAGVSGAHAQHVTRDIPYATAHERQVLDVHAPAGAKNLPVVFWIHGGGWQTGDKTMVALKPKVFIDAGFVVAGRETTHASINDNIGAANDPVTKELFAFVAEALKR